MEPGCLYVSTAGNDLNPGTKDKPFYSLAYGLQQLRSLRANHEGTIKLILANGAHYLDEPVVITPEFSGKADALTILCAEENAAPVISGGVPLDVMWKPFDHRIFVAEVPMDLSFTRLYVNGQLACLSRYPNLCEEELLGGYAEDCLSVERVGRWSNPVGGYVHGLSHHRWGSVHYRRIIGVDDQGQLVLTGGDQINRESRLHEQFRFVENIFEELDCPNEWFLDRERGLLYYYPPEGLDLRKAEFIAVKHKQLIEVRGSLEKPVRYFQIEGITFAHTDRTILEPYEPLLRGDWSIVRCGAVMLSGTEDCSVQCCRFEQIGGNAFLLNHYNLRSRFAGNHVMHCGDSGVALVGDVSAVRSPVFWQSGNIRQEAQVEKPPEVQAISHRDVQVDRPLNDNAGSLDLGAGPANSNYPMDCAIENNVIHHIGELGKQTAGIFISMSEDIAVRHNTIFHVPRAAICINDGCWGGHRIEYNDMFNSVRETNDHGPLNAWGRDRHWGVTPEIHANPKQLSRLDQYKETIISNNRFRECQVSFGIDLDDGCSNYTVTRNLCIGTGIKLREGYYRNVVNNILFGVPIRKGVCYPSNEDVIARNIVVRMHETDVWNSVMGSPGEAARIDDNLYYIYTGSEPVFCFRSPREEGINPVMSFAEWKRKGNDINSVVEDPCFKDPRQFDFSLPAHSPAFSLGFESFSTDGFGVSDPERVPELQAALAEFLPQLQKNIFCKRQETNTLYSFSVRWKETIEWRGTSLQNVIGVDEVTFTGLSKETGVIVTAIQSASFAQLCGLQIGDVILGVDGKAVDTVRDFSLFTKEEAAWTFDLLRSQEMIKVIANGTLSRKDKVTGCLQDDPISFL